MNSPLRLSLAGFLLFAMIMPLSSQCPNNIIGTSQAQLDNLMSQYPDCEQLDGSITIRGDVSDLSSLSNIESVSGNVYISQNTGLTSLAGLGGLESIGGNLNIALCSNLESLNGLGGLETVGGIIYIQSCDKLASVDALNSVRTIGGDILVKTCHALTEIGSFNALTSLGGEIRITEDSMLTTVSGFNKLTEMADGVSTAECYRLNRITGFRRLKNVGEYVDIRAYNDARITGFKLLEEAGFVRFRGDIDTIDLQNLESVFDDLKFTSTDILGVGGLNRLKTVGGDIELETGMVDLPDFDSLETVGGQLVFHSRETLEIIDGFNNLKSIGKGPIGWGFDIYEHHKLKEIRGFQSLEIVVGHFSIYNCNGLDKISGFDSLRQVIGNFVLDSNALLTDCSPFCNIVSSDGVGGDIIIRNNGPEQISGCATEEIVRTNCTFTYDIVDANLAIYPERSAVAEGNDIRELEEEDLFELDSLCQGVAADGVTPVLFRIQMPDTGTVELINPEEGFEMPWGDKTYEKEGEYFAFFLYTAPEEFDEEAGNRLPLGNGGAYDVNQPFDLIQAIGRQNFAFTYTVVRPPVVLMHGTFSSPDTAWKMGVQGQESMFDRLSAEGFNVFTVDFHETNGQGDPSSFEENAKVLYDNPGGIKNALDFYRDTLDIAVTQVDVVGHSLGGVLPRVYSSQEYNPDYERDENFMEGDINRLITIASTHFGSHLGELQTFLDQATLLDLSPLDWIVNEGRWFISKWITNTGATEAVQNQLPPPNSEALERIGNVEMPVHAITCEAGKGKLKDVVYDPAQQYYDLYWYITMMFYYNETIRDFYLDKKLEIAQSGHNASTTIEGEKPAEIFPGYHDIIWFKQMLEDGVETTGQIMAVLDGTFEPPSEIDIFRYALAETGMSDFGDPLLDLFEPGVDPVGVATDYLLSDFSEPSAEDILSRYLSVNEQNMEAVRALIFNNDRNDGVVRVESQSGELEKECENCITHFENVLHGFAPRYPDIQDRVSELLKGGMNEFHEEGFPAIDHGQKMYYPEEALSLLAVPETGGAAICASGMPPAHARAFARIADKENVIIMVRPVNPDATSLIASGAATKEMDVKPKSSNWGPQKGYLPVLQRYSKIWKVFEGDARQDKILAYDEKANENLVNNVTKARNLEVKTCDGWYDVVIDRSEYLGQENGDWEGAEDEVVLIPKSDPNKVCTWGEKFSEDMIITNCRDILPEDQFMPLQVMATPRVLEDDGVTEKYLTADYDLLMVGFYEGPGQGAPDPPTLTFKPGVGQITNRQETLVGQLNEAVSNTGYTGGAVSHHGPENQFEHSPYIDYPITVFAPDDVPNGWLMNSTGGKILSIKMGEPGFRDINLKMFINEMREQGYDLYHNEKAPGWKWTWNADADGYNLDDSKDLGDYVEQLPPNQCSKTGAQTESVCPAIIQPYENDAKPSSWLFGLRGTDQAEVALRLFPNPVESGHLNLALRTENDERTYYRVIDMYGSTVSAGVLTPVNGLATEMIDVSLLHPGMYTVAIEGTDLNVRFVKQ